MAELDLFKGNSLVSADILAELFETNKRLMSGGGAVPRISIRGSRFRQIVNGEQVHVSKEDSMNIMVIEAGPLARTYFEGTYSSDNPTPPTCWSKDTKKPADDVPEDDRMAPTCSACPMNIKGSGQGDSRACRFSQRLAVMLENDEEETVYQLQVPAASLFGDKVGNRMPLQAYVKFLDANKAPIQAVITRMTFDEDSESPKLFFSPVRGLNEEEVALLLEKRGSEEVEKALDITVTQAEPKAEDEDEKPKRRSRAKADDDDEDEKPKRRSRAKADDDDEDEEEAPRVKRTSSRKKSDDEEEGGDLADILGSW